MNDKKFYAVNFKPQQASYGQDFLYDGIHNFEYWKNLNKQAKYEDFWKIRNDFLLRNRNAADNMKKFPIHDVANFMINASSEERIIQTLETTHVWHNIKNIVYKIYTKPP